MSTSQPLAVLRSRNVFPTFVEAECTRQVHPGRMTSEEVPLLGAPKFHSPLTSCRKQPQLCKHVSVHMLIFKQHKAILDFHLGTLWPVLTNVLLDVGAKVQEVSSEEAGQGPVVVSMRARLQGRKIKQSR